MLMLILIGIASENAPQLFFLNEPVLAIFMAVFLYIFIVSLIYSQNIRLGKFARQNKGKMLMLANAELAIFFIAYYFIFGIHHLFSFGKFFLAASFSAIFAILLYLGGLAAFNYAQNMLVYGRQQALSKTQLQITFLIPFLLPFVLYLVLSDLSVLIPWENLRQVIGIGKNSYGETFIIFLFGLVFIAMVTVFIPQAVVLCWRCKDLADSELKNKLIALCQKARFKYSALKTWDIVQDSMTAAIIGVWGSFRYVMFTPSLLRQLSSNAIEAVLAHEIGHSKSRHLLIYPFIIFGIFLISSFLAFTIYPHMMYLLESQITLTFQAWNALGSLLFFIVFALLLAILFRLVFGYFSRVFERQADLYVIELGLPAAYLIEAFDEIAIASGRIHDLPNWHHYSFRERMDFLQKAENNPSLIYMHRRKVMFSLLAYFLCLGTLSYYTVGR